MKRILLIAITLFISQHVVNGQITCPIDENFDIGNVFTSTGTPAWAINSNYSVSSPNSILGKYGVSTFSQLTSQPVSTAGSSVVTLKFKHICKISSQDGGIIEVDTGTGSWLQLTSLNCTYTGSAITFNNANGHHFNSLSYPVLWKPGNDALLPDNTWWKQEAFDISTLAANRPNFRIRFNVGDQTPNGMVGNYGWLIDDVQLCYSTCELTSPVIVPELPLLSGVVYTPGPFTVCFDMTDSSSVVTSEMYFDLNGTGFQPIGGLQQNSATQWCGFLPVTLNPGDTVRWYIEALDGSCNNNSGYYPLSGYNTFWFSASPEVPFCDFFDSPGQFWADSSASGSSWQLGTPASGGTNSPFSFPNSWDIDLNSGYQNNSNQDL